MAAWPRGRAVHYGCGNAVPQRELELALHDRFVVGIDGVLVTVKRRARGLAAWVEWYPQLLQDADFERAVGEPDTERKQPMQPSTPGREQCARALRGTRHERPLVSIQNDDWHASSLLSDPSILCVTDTRGRCAYAPSDVRFVHTL